MNKTVLCQYNVEKKTSNGYYNIMNYLLTCNQLENLDKEAILNYKIPSILLIEQASFGAFNKLKKEIKDFSKKSFLIICGKGNNAGDGLALARNIYYTGNHNIVIALTNEIGSESFNIELQIIRNLGLKIISYSKIKDFLSSTEIIIDALYGTGFKAPLRTEGKNIIELINSQKNKTIISLDIPSGLSDTTQFSASSVRANYTVTFGKIKSCFYPPKNRDRVGKLFLVNPGFPLDLLDKTTSNLQLFDFKDIVFDKKENSVHKNNRGHIAIFSGDEGKVGAAVLAGKAAFQSGAGLVTFIGGEEKEFPQFMSEKKFEKDKYNAVLFGNGRDPNLKLNQDLLLFLLKEDSPLILDAGAIKILNKFDKEVFKNRKNILVLTPHAGEFESLGKSEVTSKNYINYCLSLSKKFNATIIIKNFVTWIVNANSIYIYDNPNSSLAVAGTGDVLAGIVVSLIGQGFKVEKACQIAVAFHNEAGQLLSKENPYFDSVQLINILPKVLKEFI